MKKLFIILIFCALTSGLKAQYSVGSVVDIDTTTKFSPFKINYMLMDSLKLEPFKIDIPLRNYMVIYDHTFKIPRYYPAKFHHSLNVNQYLAISRPGYLYNKENSLNPYGVTSIEEAISIGLINMLLKGIGK